MQNSPHNCGGVICRLTAETGKQKWKNALKPML